MDTSQGYMTVGEVAKKMGVTVRTLQYYDREGVLSPSSLSEGGRRLYTHKDIVKLHQIRSMKYLGFSLDDIKTRLPSIDTPEEVAGILSEQANAIRAKIHSLSEILEYIEKLNIELLQMKTVDWVKYADILSLLQSKSDLYWIVKHFDGEFFDHIRTLDKEISKEIIEAQQQMFKKAREYEKRGISPESEQGQALAKDFWDVIIKFTKGDMNLISTLSKLHDSQEGVGEWRSKQAFMDKALEIYLQNIGFEPC